MWTLSTTISGLSRSIALGLGTLGLTTLVPGAGVQAQDRPPFIVMTSGLQTFAPGHTVRTSVSELGSGAAANVRIELRNPQNKVVAFTDGELSSSSPVQLDVTVPPGELVQLSTRVTVFSRTALTTVPAAVLEDIGPDQVTIEPRTQCTGPPSGRVGAQLSCGGCPGWSVVTSLVAGA